MILMYFPFSPGDCRQTCGQTHRTLKHEFARLGARWLQWHTSAQGGTLLPRAALFVRF